MSRSCPSGAAPGAAGGGGLAARNYDAAVRARIDGKVIINRTCHIGISGDTREWAMNGVAEVYMNHDLSDRPFYARFQRHGRWLNYGRVETVDALEEHICWGNKRFHMCFSQPYLICDPDDGNLPKQLETYP